jgi:DNA-binding MarR family transcriptional regulator
MPDRLKREIKQSRPFASLEAEAFLNVLRTAEALTDGLHALLKPAGLSPTQYNVLRILRGAGATTCDAGLPCGEVSARMVTRDPDLTRLLDRLEKRGLIGRERQSTDRRVVHVAITGKGRSILDEIDPQVTRLHKRQFHSLAREDLLRIVDLMERTRESVESADSTPKRNSASS